MNNKKIFPVLLVVLAGVILSACSGGVGANNFPGMTISGNLAYISFGAQVRAVNLTDGTIPWRFPVKAENKAYYAAPLVMDDKIVVTNYSGELYALNKDGNAAWTAPFVAKGRWYGAPILCGDLIVGANGDDVLYALNQNGGVEWQISEEAARADQGGDVRWGSFWSTPVCDESTIYLSSLDQRLFAIDIATHDILWYVDLKASATARPVIHDGYVYIGTLAGDLYKIKTSDHKDVKVKHLEGEIWTSPVFKDESVFIGVKPTKKTGMIYMLSISNLSEEVNPTDTESPITTSGVFVEDGVVFGTEGGIFYKSDLNGDVIKWDSVIPGKVFTDPVFLDGKLWVAVFGGDDLLRYYNSEGNLSESFRLSAK